MTQQFTMRTRAEVTGFFDGLALVEPGVVLTHEWRQDADGPGNPGVLWVGMWRENPEGNALVRIVGQARTIRRDDPRGARLSEMWPRKNMTKGAFHSYCGRVSWFDPRSWLYWHPADALAFAGARRRGGEEDTMMM